MNAAAPILTAFQRAAREVPAYRDILAEAGVDPTRITSIDAFRHHVPLVDKAGTFGRFPLAALCRGGRLGKPAWVLTSSGHSGRFAFGMYGAENADEAVRRLDDALDLFLGVRSKSTLLINCLPMGVKVYTQACTLAETSVREDLVVALVKAFGEYYEQIALVGEAAFIKCVLELGERQKVDWQRQLVHVVVGEEPLAENARIYLEGLLGIDFARPETGRILSSMGVAELGLNLFCETGPLVALRRVLHGDAPLREAILGPGTRCVPMIFAYDPEWIFVEVMEDGRLVISTLDGARRIPLIRYVTGDEVRLLTPSDALRDAARQAALKPGELDATAALMVCGRGQYARAGDRRVYPEEVKEALYADPGLARQTTMNFRLRSGSPRALLRVQLVPGTRPATSLADRFAEALARYTDTPLEVRCEPYEDFHSGMSLDYERKFAYLDEA
jgi:phenylacetate-CoA ligase